MRDGWWKMALKRALVGFGVLALMLAAARTLPTVAYDVLLLVVVALPALERWQAR
jgi:hypothetical protein